MNKKYLVILFFLLIILFSGCTKTNEYADADNKYSIEIQVKFPDGHTEVFYTDRFLRTGSDVVTFPTKDGVYTTSYKNVIIIERDR